MNNSLQKRQPLICFGPSVFLLTTDSTTKPSKLVAPMCRYPRDLAGFAMRNGYIGLYRLTDMISR
jgi:hypothetical protein